MPPTQSDLWLDDWTSSARPHARGGEADLEKASNTDLEEGAHPELVSVTCEGSTPTCIYRHKWESLDLHVFDYVTEWLRALFESWKKEYSMKETISDRIREELRDNPLIPLEVGHRWAARMERCCHEWDLFRGPEGEMQERPRLCKVTACPYCRLWYVLRGRRRLEAYVRAAREVHGIGVKNLLYGTITQRGEAERTAKESYKLLRYRLRKLWKDRDVRQAIVGGFVAIEYTVSRYSGWINWHYHANVILEVVEEYSESIDFVDRLIKDTWRRICGQTGDHAPGEVRTSLERVRPGYQQEMVKYSVKVYDSGAEIWSIDPWAHGLGHHMVDMRGSRLLSAVGDWYGIPREKPESEWAWVADIKKSLYCRSDNVDFLQWARNIAKDFVKEVCCEGTANMGDSTCLHPG